MMLHELKAKNPDLPSFEILATDISENALNYAKAAKYSQLEVQRGLAITQLMKYFTKVDNDYWELKPEIKNYVKFVFSYIYLLW